MKLFYALSLIFIFFLNVGLVKGSIKKEYIYTNKSDSITLRNHEKTIKKFAKEKRYDSAIFYSKKLLEISEKIHDSTFIAKSNFRLGFYYLKQNILDTSFIHYNKSYKINVSLKDSISAVSRLISMANIQKELGDYIGSRITALDGLNHLKNSFNYNKTLSLYHIISVCSKELNDHDGALLWNKKALKLAINYPDIILKKDLVILQNTEANINVKFGKYKKAIEQYSKLLQDSVILNNKIERARIIDNLAYAKMLSKGRNKENELLLFKALNIRIQNNDIPNQIASYIHLTKFYSKLNKEKSLEYAKSAYNIAKQYNSSVAILESLEYIIQLKKDLNKNATEEAFIYTNTRNHLKKTSQRIRRIYAITKYDNDQLINDNLFLRAETAKKQKQNVIYLSAFIIACLIMVFAFYFIKKRAELLKQQNKLEKLETIYKTEAELSRRLHDDFGAKINHSMLLVQNNADKSKLLDTLDELYNQSRDFSREINEIDTGANYKKELFTMLSTYTATNVKLYTTGSKEVDWVSLTDLSKTALYKILRELMINMAKYSNATTVKIAFKKMPDSLQIYYSDNGVGASKMAMNTKNGLRNTEKRIKAIGGTIIFETEKGEGFKAEIKIPN